MCLSVMEGCIIKEIINYLKNGQIVDIEVLFDKYDIKVNDYQWSFLSKKFNEQGIEILNEILNNNP